MKIVLSDALERNVQEASKCLILLIFNVNEKNNLFLLIIKSALNSRLNSSAAAKVIMKKEGYSEIHCDNLHFM